VPASGDKDFRPNQAQIREISVKAKARVAAIYSRSCLPWSQIAAFAPSFPRRTGSGAPASPRCAFALSSFLAIGVLLLAAVPASAEVVHVLQPTGSNSFPFSGLSSPLGVAEDQAAHLIYVSDSSNGTVHKFTAAGKPQNFSALGSSELAVPSIAVHEHYETTNAKGEVEILERTYFVIAQIGVDNSEGASAGDIYVPDSVNHRVDKFDPNGKLDATTPFIGEGTLSAPTAVAVDESGDLFVAENSAGVVDEFSPAGALLNTFGSGHLANLFAIAVGPVPREKVYVGTYSDGLVEFEHSGGCTNSCEPLDRYQILGLGIDAHGNVFADDTGDGVREHSSSGTFLEGFGNIGDFQGQPSGIAIDGTSEDVYVADPPNHVVKVYKPFPAYRLSVSISGTGHGYVSSQPGTISCGANGSECAENFKVGAKVTLTAETTGPGHSKFTGWSGECSYEHGNECEVEMTAARSVKAGFEAQTFPEEVETEAPTELTGTSATLRGKVNPEGLPLTECYFEYGESTPETTDFGLNAGNVSYTQKAECEPSAGSISGLLAASVKAPISLASFTGPVHYRLYTANSDGASVGSDQTVPIPVAEADTVHEINGEGKVTVHGTLEPNGADTHYHFEFVTEQQLEDSGFSEAVSTPSEDGGTGGTDFLDVEAPELNPGTGYDFRLAAESEALPGHALYSPVKTIPKPHAFEPALASCPNEADRYGASARLPDCRAYEQVTPANKEGAQEITDYANGFKPETSTADNGESFLLMNSVSRWGINVGGGSDPGSSLQVYDFKRTPSGWETVSFNPQPQTGQVENNLYHMFTPDLTSFLVERQWNTGLAHSRFKEYAIGPAGGPYTTVADEPFEPNISQFGGWRGQSRDGNLGVIESEDHELIPGHPTHTVGTSWNHEDLYAYSARTGLVQVNVESNGEPIGTNGTCGARTAQGLEAGSRGGDHDQGGGGGNGTGGINSISTDGSRIFFNASPGECTSADEINEPYLGTRSDVYMREPYAGKTYDLGQWVFEGANSDGTRVLLGRWAANHRSVEYFVYNTETKEAKHAFSTAGPIGDIGYPIHAMSEEGNVLYFANIGALNRETTLGANIWRYDLETETLTYVGRYSGNHGGPYGANVSVTQYGEGLQWQDETAPTGAEQAYTYDATEQVLNCIACDSPSFNPATAQPSFNIVEGGGGFQQYGPVVTPASANGDYVFFETANALLPDDIDGDLVPTPEQGAFSPSTDIYEWRRYGLDGCSLRQGCLALTSNGVDGLRNQLLGVSPSGRDVFFLTRSQLVAQDKDTSFDIYDARIDGGYPPPPPPPPPPPGAPPPPPPGGGGEVIFPTRPPPPPPRFPPPAPTG